MSDVSRVNADIYGTDLACCEVQKFGPGTPLNGLIALRIFLPNFETKEMTILPKSEGNPVQMQQIILTKDEAFLLAHELTMYATK